MAARCVDRPIAVATFRGNISAPIYTKVLLELIRRGQYQVRGRVGPGVGERCEARTRWGVGGFVSISPPCAGPGCFRF